MENKVKRRDQELSDTNKMLVKEMEQREKTHNELLQTKEKLNRQESWLVRLFLPISPMNFVIQ